MAIKTTLLCLNVVFIVFVQCQNIDEKRHGTLQEMIDYARRFNRNAQPPDASDSVGSSRFEGDPLLRELFKEFLVQYQQLAGERTADVKGIPQITSTTSTTETIFKAEPRRFVNVLPAPEATPVPQRRRISPRRKVNNPEATRPWFSYVSNFPRHEPVVLESTMLPSLKQVDAPVLPVAKAESVGTTKFQIPKITKKQPSNNIPSESEGKFDEKEFRRQAESAKYEFASEINDEINGNLHQREEVRDGLAVKGKYSYSDGYYRRTVHYEADDKGYRVVKEEVEPLEGPQANPDGHAKVTSYVAGKTVNYEITQDDIAKKNRKMTFNEVLEDEGSEI